MRRWLCSPVLRVTLMLGIFGCRATPPDDSGETVDSVELDGRYPIIASGLSAALLRVWVSPDGDVWAVGADDGAGPLVLHFDGTSWNRIDTGHSGDLWWLWSDGEGTLWMSGGEGWVLEHELGSGVFREVQVAKSRSTIFGIWGASSSDIWAVVSDVSRDHVGQILHYDGIEWTESSEVSSSPEGEFRQPFKVWGSGPDDVHVVGTDGLAMHWDGGEWNTWPAPVADPLTLFTVHGSGPDHAVAVGGSGSGVTAHWDGSSWTESSPASEQFPPGLIGVYAHPTHGVVAVGNNGAMWRYDGVAWSADPQSAMMLDGLHSVFVEDDGGVWAVGGDLFALDQGVIVYGGPREIPPVPVDI